MKPVARALIIPLVDWIRSNGHPCADVFADLEVDERALRTVEQRVSWVEFVTLYERLAVAVGGEERLWALQSAMPTPALDWLAGSLRDPFEALLFWACVAPLLWGVVGAEVERRPESRVFVRLRAPSPPPDAGVWLRATREGVLNISTRLGLPRGTLVAEESTGHTAEWVVHYPGAAPEPDPPTSVALSVAAAMAANYAETLQALDEANRQLDEVTSGSRPLEPSGLFLLNASLELVWTTPPGEAWISATPGATRRLVAATRAEDPQLLAIPLNDPLGHHLVMLRDASVDFEARVAAVTQAWVLTRAQVQVLRGILAGRSNKQIAAQLGNAEATVEVHVTRLLRKAGAHGRTALVSRFWGAPLRI
jgi:DNA-binding CsgD family transcriptional regulator